MTDKRGPGREHERRSFQPEYQKPQETIDVGKEMHNLAESINPAEQMPEASKDLVSKLLDECKKGKCKAEKVLKENGYTPLDMSKFDNPEDVHEGHIAYLYANNLLTEGRNVVIGKYEDGYAVYHKA